MANPHRGISQRWSTPDRVSRQPEPVAIDREKDGAFVEKHALGIILKAHWLGLAADKGFENIYSCARPGASQALNVRFGAGCAARTRLQETLACDANHCRIQRVRRMYTVPVAMLRGCNPLFQLKSG